LAAVGSRRGRRRVDPGDPADRPAGRARGGERVAALPGIDPFRREGAPRAGLPRAREPPTTHGKEGQAMARGIRGPEARYGWAFVAPAIVIIGVFLVLPILLALWVSFSNWNGLGSPLANSSFVGGENYQRILVDSGLAQ